MWLAQFLFGMFLAYLILSPKLRRFVFGQHHTPNTQTRETKEGKQERNKPQSANILRSGHEIEVSEGEVEKWMASNKDLWEINGGK